MKVEFIELDKITVKDRARQQFTPEALEKLQESISDPHVGLLHPIRLNNDLHLIVGERRVRAVRALHMLDIPIMFNGMQVPNGTIPAIVCGTSLEQIQHLKMELEENVARENFTFLEEAQLTARIARMREACRRVEKSPEKEIVPEDIPLKDISREAVKETAAKVFPDITLPEADKNVKNHLAVVNLIESAPESEVAKKLSKAASMNEANKILENHIKEEKRAALANTQGKAFASKQHTIIHGDCLVELPKLAAGSFDVCCCDPIYGRDAHKFGDAVGKMAGKNHDYDDSLENFKRIMPVALRHVSKLLKREAHIYLACDLRNLELLEEYLRASDDPQNPWKIPRYPIIQHKPEGGRVPHPGYSCRRSYEIWLYAYRGGKQEYNMINDVVTCSSDRSESHGAAKPIGLLKTFLRRSCMPGDRVLDFMAGSGGIIEAGHELNLRVTAIELGQVNYGRCLERVRALQNGNV
jgi:adenine-specific DNA-methyltransferase